MVCQELEDEFTRTCKLLINADLVGLDVYGPWLGKRVPLPFPTKSAVSGKEVWVQPSINFMGRTLAKSKCVSMDEMDMVSRTSFKYEDIRDANLKTIMDKIIKPVEYAIGNYRYKTYENVEKCSGAGDCRNAYYGEDLYMGLKNAAFSNYAMFSQNIFGCHNVPYSQFCIHAYNSVSINRAFEVDGCYHSNDILFCHNSEFLNNCMFCFNTKGKKYAIGNVEVGKDEYLRVRKILLDYVGRTLLETKALKLDIYDVGAGSEA